MEGIEIITDDGGGIYDKEAEANKPRSRPLSGEDRPLSGESLNLSGTVKRGYKMSHIDQDAVSLSATLKRGMRNQGMLEAIPTSKTDSPGSPRNSKRFSFKSPKKSKKLSSKNDDTISIMSSAESHFTYPRGLRIEDVRGTPFDDTVSMIGGFIMDAGPFQQQDGIRDTIGRKNIVTLKKMIKLERGNVAVDPKVLVLTPYRFQILSTKAPFKMEADIHFLEVKALDSPTPERLIVTTDTGKIYFMQMIGTDDADHIIGRVALSLRTIFPNVALSRIIKASLEPLGRQKIIQSMLNQGDQSEPGPCGNFSEMYRCICDYLGAPVREEVEWDVDTIYLSQNCKEINTKDFDLPDTKDIIPIISVMIYSQWFDGLVVRNTKLSFEVLEFVLKVTRNSHNLKELSLEGVGIKGEFAHRLSINMIENKECRIEVLDLSGNSIEDKGLVHLSGSLPVIKHGSFRHLSLARTGITAKSINVLCQALRSSQRIMTTLTHLNLSGNNIRPEDAEGLLNFLSTENQITDLDLSATEGAVELYLSAIAKGCTKSLENVSLGKNVFQTKKSKDTAIPPSVMHYFHKTTSLKLMDISHTKMPPEAIRYIMDGILANKTPGLQVALNLSSCELKSMGCHIIQSCVASLTNLVSLDLTDNMLDGDLLPLLGCMQQNRSITEFKIGRNFFGVKPKYMRQVMEGIVELMQEEDSVLQTFCIADSKLREHLHILLGCLGSNTSLTSIDISGNYMGDNGARVLSKSLQINSKLQVVKLDRNSLTSLGFHEVANAMEKNYTLRYMPYPVNDAVIAIKMHPERTQRSLARIQDLLLRNANATGGSNDQQFRLQQVVTNTAQQVLDRVAEKVDDTVNALEILVEDSASNDSVIIAKKLVKDAKNSKQLLSDIYGIGMEKCSGDESPLVSKIRETAKNLNKIVEENITKTIESMMKTVEAQCPHIFMDIKEELERSIETKCQLPKDSVRDYVMHTSGSVIVNQVSELNLSMATMMSDRIADRLLGALSQSNLTLTDQLNKHKQKENVGKRSTDDVVQVDEDGALLPDMRRNRAASIAKRKQRPDVQSSLMTDDPAPKSPTESDTITDFGVYDPYSNEKVKTRKKKAREEKAAREKEEAEAKKAKEEKEEEEAKKVEEETEEDDVKNAKEEKDEPEEKREKEDEDNIAAEVKKEKKEGEEKKEKGEKEDAAKKKKEREEAERIAKEEKKRLKEEKKKGNKEKEDKKKVKEEKEDKKKVKEEKEDKKKVKEEKEDKKKVKGEEKKKATKPNRKSEVDETKLVASAPDPPPVVEAVKLEDLPVVETKKLDHLTKGRPRGPRRRPGNPRSRPTEPKPPVDDFFSTTRYNTGVLYHIPRARLHVIIVSNTDFDKPQPEASQEDTSDKPSTHHGKHTFISAEQIKINVESRKDESDQPKEEEKPRRPKGAMVMPGMGIGGNIIAEMKAKKFNRNRPSESEEKKDDPPKSPSEKDLPDPPSP
ncbi:F-actin-uncapping protein LRRC16A-like isoform X2 [Ciona intestinalis]